MAGSYDKYSARKQTAKTKDAEVDLTSTRERVMMPLEQTANLENEISALPSVQADREYTSPSGCHVKMFFRKEHDPGIRKEIARLLLTAFEKEGNDEHETCHVSVQSIDERSGR